MKTRPYRQHREAGFTIVEAMIGIALGLVVLAALTSFLVSTSVNRTELERNSRQIENGRYAIDTLRNEIRMAGFFAELQQTGATLTAPTPCQTPAGAVADLGLNLAPLRVPVAVFGYPDGDPALPLPCLPNRVAGTDVLVLRRLSTEMTPVALATPSQVYVQLSRCATDSTTTPWAIDLGSNSATFKLRRTDCGGVTDLYSVRVEAYYVRDFSATAGDGIPTLVKVELDGPTAGGLRTSPLVEGVRAATFFYGIDNDNDGAPDEYRHCDAASPCTLAQWNNVVAVRVSLLAENLEPSVEYTDTRVYDLGLAAPLGPYNDKRKRHVYSAAVSLPNKTGPRE